LVLIAGMPRHSSRGRSRRIEFDDLHDTGIYSWDYLHHLGSHKYPLMKQYPHSRLDQLLLFHHRLSAGPGTNPMVVQVSAAAAGSGQVAGARHPDQAPIAPLDHDDLRAGRAFAGLTKEKLQEKRSSGKDRNSGKCIFFLFSFLTNGPETR
jgi:hypothetical protein